MATQTIEYVSCTKLCCGTLPAPVVLCIPSDLVLNGTEAVEATLVSVRCFTVGCQLKWIHQFVVDADQLIPEVTLSGSEIFGVFCQNCETRWTKGLLGVWQDWAVEGSASEDMTWTGITINVARFRQDANKLVHFYLDITGTTGGTGSNELRFTLPVLAAGLVGVGGFAKQQDGLSSSFAATVWVVNTDQGQAAVTFNVANDADFSLGTDRRIIVDGWYEAA